jgi:hypothetical protein
MDTWTTAVIDSTTEVREATAQAGHVCIGFGRLIPDVIIHLKPAAAERVIDLLQAALQDLQRQVHPETTCTGDPVIEVVDEERR